MNFGLRDSDLEYMRNLFARESAIDQVWLYGSRAKGEHRNTIKNENVKAEIQRTANLLYQST